MSALSQTAASVIFSVNAAVGPVLTAGATIAKGQPCYLDASTNTVKLMGAAVTSGMTTSSQYGLAYYGAASGQPIQLVPVDPGCTLGATMAAGFPVQLHTTAGSFTQTQADLTTANIGVTFGSATSTTVLNLRISIGGAL